MWYWYRYLSNENTFKIVIAVKNLNYNLILGKSERMVERIVERMAWPMVPGTG